MNANELLHGGKIMTVGIIVDAKPVYNKRSSGEVVAMSYNLTIRTPHKVKRNGEEIPIVISARGKRNCWHSYHILQFAKEPISISGIRYSTRYQEIEVDGELKKMFWVFLKRDPPPNMICNKTIDELFDELTSSSS